MPMLSFLLSLLLSVLPALAPNGYDAVRQRAEASYAEKSFGRAHEAYEEAARLDLTAGERRWVAFRLADTAWRSDAASPAPDPTVRAAAQKALEQFVAESNDDRDRIWAEAQESLGDFDAVANRYQYSAGDQHYLQALDWWAGSADLDLARRRYLEIVWKLFRARQGYGQAQEDGSRVPRNVLVDAIAIAQTPADRDRLRYHLATQLLTDGTPASAERGLELLDQIIADGKATDWYDDALFAYGMQLVQRGRAVVTERGDPALRQDYVRALELFRRLVDQFTKEQTRYFDQAQTQIRALTVPNVEVEVGSTFLPDSEQEVALAWRNVQRVELSLTPVDLTALDLSGNNSDLLHNVQLDPSRAIRRWTFETHDDGQHVPGAASVRIAPRLPAGAYAIAASAGESHARRLLLVTDANVVLQTLGGRTQAYVSSALTGEPLPGAHVAAWQHDGRRTTSQRAQTDANGLADLKWASGLYASLTVCVSTAEGRPAYARVQTYDSDHGRDEWRIYAFTDRPAYRPEETVHWKIIARTGDGEQWQTPAGMTLHYEIVSPRSEVVSSGDAKLGPFGGFWADLPLTSVMPLGAYSIRFGKDSKNGGDLGWASLFRLEEYKLPEYRVSVSTAAELGKRKVYRLGETIEATVEASYYFGGAVANATVDVRVTTTPEVRRWFPYRAYPWYYDDESASSDYRYGGEQEVLHQTLKTDSNGKVTVRIDTPRDGSERTYTIAANVTDASRREVSGTGFVHVMRQRYAVYATPQHYIHRPGEKASVDFKALDANDGPVVTTGTVTVTRLTRHIGAGSRRPEEWKQDPVQTARIATDAKGEATFTFTPPRNGYYTVAWTSEDRVDGKGPVAARDVVTAAATLWVTERNVSDLDYRSGALDVVVDNDTLHAGERVPVLILTPASGRWVVVTTTTNDIVDTRVIHLDGTVKLLEVPIDERYSPNFFITATSVYDRSLSTVTKKLIVPPVEKFVSVEVKPDREQYEPKQKGRVTITTRDADGRPVSAEVALSVADESVTAISADPAGDPRQFFFHDLRQAELQVTASVQQQRYARLSADEKGNLIDEQEKARRERVREENVVDGVTGGVEGGVAGGAIGGVLSKDRPPPPSPVALPSAVAEAIAVTAEAPKMKNGAPAGGWMYLDVDAQSRNGQESPARIEVRNDFRSTAFWQPDLITGADGTATATFEYPQALTTWRATARAATAGSQFGMGTATTKTNLPLLVRLQAPRFFVAGDRVTISAVVNNNSDVVTRVTPSLEAEGVTLVTGSANELDVPAHGEARADWTALAGRAGSAKLRVTARDSAHGDAMEKTFTVYEHGIDKLIARSGKLRAAEATVRLDLPRERRATTLDVQVAPSLATTMLDALPYLIDFPYGCTEQTMSRFLPAAIVARTLAKNGLDTGDLDGRIFGGIEQPTAGATHPQGRKDLHRLDDMTSASMNRLYDFQHQDGGWGWWKGGSSDDFMTAYVVWGFAVAKEGGLPVRDASVDRAVRWLDAELVKREDDPAEQTWMLHALAAWRAAASRSKNGTSPAAAVAMNAPERKAFEGTFKNREHLSAYSRALLALAAHDFGESEPARVLVRNLEDGVKLDRKPDESILVAATAGTSAAETMATAHWGADRVWWRWYDGPVETTAFALQALVAVDPGNKLIEPVMNWLVKNRRGAQWSNTRDTAIALLALNDYLQASGELAGAVSFDVSVNGHLVASKTIAAGGVLQAPPRFAVGADLLRDGVNEIRIRRTAGSSPLYFSAEARFVSLEEPVKAAGNELFVRRDYVRLVPHPTLLKGVVYERVPLRDGESVAGGERVEVVLTIEPKNDYDYLIFEDLKPAGLEAVATQSGETLYATELRESKAAKNLGAAEKPTITRRNRDSDTTGRGVYVYQELRDRKVANFIDHLPQGIWELRYALRAEVPGSFHALPVIGQAMYVPEIRANGDEVRITVTER